MLIGYDSTTLGAIPHHPQVVFAYHDGDYSDYMAARRLFPHSHVFSIAVRAEDDADFLDIEKLDATPPQAHDWLARQLKRGVWRPGLYGSISTMPAIEQAIAGLHIPREHYRLWSAHYTGTPHVEDGCDGTQWTDRALGRNLDESLLYPTFIPPKPALSGSRIWRATVGVDLKDGHWTVTPERQGS